MGISGMLCQNRTVRTRAHFKISAKIDESIQSEWGINGAIFEPILRYKAFFRSDFWRLMLLLGRNRSGRAG